MKRIFFAAIMLIGFVSFAQQERNLELNKVTDLIDVIYYHDNGEVSQTGSYTKDGKLHGNWMSYSENGKKIASAQYHNGVKVGKWFYWNDNTLTEVDYSKNDIASINRWVSMETLASN